MQITMYTKRNCPQCVIAKGKLNSLGIQFEEVMVDRDEVARNKMIEAGHRSVPIFYEDGKHVSLEDLLE